MDSRLLRAFVTVAEVGGISAAAERLGCAQSTLSAQLRRLEGELGVTVVNRTSTGTPLTAVGHRLLPYAREALEIEDRMRRAADESRPRLRIGALEALASAWLPDILTALGYGAGGPDADAEVSITVRNRAGLTDDLAAGRLDLLFLFEDGSTPPGPSSVLGHEQVVLVSEPTHPLADAPAVAVEARWRPGLGAAEPTLQAILRLARRHTALLRADPGPAPPARTAPADTRQAASGM